MVATTFVSEKKKPRTQGVQTTLCPDRLRVQIDFTPEAYTHLDRMKKKANVKSNADLVKNALRLYDWYLAKRDEDYRFLIAKGDSLQQVEVVL